jgi:ABC-type antimicrobial peptide transport system permease subunit
MGASETDGTENTYFPGAFIVSLAAGLIGYGAGMGITRLLAEFFADKATVFAPDPAIAAVAVILAVATGLTASFYPAAAASRMDPSEALRTL